ncbi:hypothetical protein HDU96_008933 [Phlyctochytrium bullatum]|nr:hypothetical protein HDU96_008933 [Phlyctochytrium bullatum]
MTFERILTALIYSAIGICLGLFLAYRYDLYTKLSKPEITGRAEELEQPGSTVPLRGIVNLIRNYLWATLASAIIVMFFDLGKIFSTIGAVHNACEVAICVILAKRNGFQIVQPVIFVYLTQLWFLCNVLPWPFDALYFKWQGLAFDCYIFLMFLRLYQVNKALFLSGNSATGPLLGDNDGTSKPVYKKLVLCSVASLVHFLGNVYTSVDSSYFAFIVFQTCYGIAYPFYGYFVYSLTPSDVIKRVPTSFVSETLWAIVSLLTSTAVIGLGIFAAGMSGGNGHGSLVMAPAPNVTLAVGM